MSAILTQHEQRNAMVRYAARKYNVAPDDILGPSRREHLLPARWYAMTLIRHHFKDSYPRIGKRFGRDHASVINGISRFFGYQRPSKNAAAGSGLAIEIFLALHEEELTAAALEAIEHDENAKLAARCEAERERALEEFQAIVSSWPAKQEIRHAA